MFHNFAAGVFFIYNTYSLAINFAGEGMRKMRGKMCNDGIRQYVFFISINKLS